jgi:phosphoribosylformylglycinamidine synthase
MSKPKVLVMRTAGINCDKETALAFQLAGGQVDLCHINHIKKNLKLDDYCIIAIPGGFSYGDDLGAGKIFSLQLILWFKEELKKFVKGGGLILGICNGFQVLVRTGILPDLSFEQKVTLTFNDRGRFEDRWVYLQMADSRWQRAEDRRQRTDGRSQRSEENSHSAERIAQSVNESKQKSDFKSQSTENEKEIKKPENIWLKNLPQIFNLPVAHGEGKFYAEGDILDKIEGQGQAVLRYVDSRGNLNGYPFNPNGSLNNVAGLTDESGRILGLMPHPERFIFKHQWPYWKEKELEPIGLKIFENGVNYFK